MLLHDGRGHLIVVDPVPLLEPLERIDSAPLLLVAPQNTHPDVLRDAVDCAGGWILDDLTRSRSLQELLKDVAGTLVLRWV
jgi:hypothetical protein